MTLISQRHAQTLQRKNQAVWPTHYYDGTHNVWTGEVVHDCACGQFSSEDKREVMEHVEAVNKEEGQ